ncbi:MAG TPA: outer membrane protein transport protein [Polyangiaceae bacterium]|nr:outer membrane protein transport protein [Polyangiaceae bacterium]
MRRIIVASAVVLGSLVVPREVLAAGLTVARFGAEHGHPMTTEPTAVYYNPSGIADSEGGHVFGDVTLAFRRASYEHARASTDATDPTGAEGANTGRATLSNVIAEPFVGATYRIQRFALGAAFYTPFGGQNSWDENGAYRGNATAPGAVDGVQRWYAISGVLRSSYFTLATAYSFGPVSVGVSANLIQTVADTVQARNSNGGDDVRTEGRAWLDAHSWDPSLGLGVTVTPLRDKSTLRLGLSYQSQPNLGGGIVTKGTLHTSFAGRRADSDVRFTTDLPDVLRAGVAYRPREDVEVRLFGDYQRWSVLDHQCIYLASSRCNLNPDGSAQPGSAVILNFVRNWHDTFGVRAGGSYWMDPRLELLAGVGYTSKAVPDSTLEPALLDFDAVSASAGAVFAYLGPVRIATTYTHVFYLPRDTTGRSLHPTFAAPSNSPDSSGKYTLALDLLNVNADVRF